MLENYLTILEDSLQKKEELLNRIMDASQAQYELLKQEKLDYESFDKYVNEKDGYLEELEKLDEGFEALYNHIKDELEAHKEECAQQIKQIQTRISAIMDKSVSIQTREKRNRDMVAAHLNQERLQLGQNRKTIRAAYNYYQAPRDAGAAENSIMDLKK